MDIENLKLKRELNFYLYTGILVYGLNIALNIVDFYQRYGSDIFGYIGFASYFTLNIFFVYKITRLRNWARNLFIVKFVIFALVFYPQTVILQGDSWMYSPHFPHGAFQRMSNFGNFAFELFFVMYLVKRSIRLAFVRS